MHFYVFMYFVYASLKDENFKNEIGLPLLSGCVESCTL